MIHSPRRLSPTLQIQQEVVQDFGYIGAAAKEPLSYRPSVRSPRPRTRDDSITANHRSSNHDESMRKYTIRRSQTISPDRKSRFRTIRQDTRDLEEKQEIRTHGMLPSRLNESLNSRMSPTSPPSTSTTISSTTSNSTIDSQSMVTTDSEQGSPQNFDGSLPPLQISNNENPSVESLKYQDLDSKSFDLISPLAATPGQSQYSLEVRSDLLFSSEHLQIIFNDPSLLLKFTSFLSSYRVSSIPILVYYLDSIKALKAISYSNAIAEALEPIDGIEFTSEPFIRTRNSDLEEKSKKAFEILVREDLPAYITYVYKQTVSQSIQRRITGTLPVHLREASEGLAEVFCMTDPSRPDNPIIFSSEEFHRTTQYGIPYVIGRNCRFLQGPKTNPFSVKRFREKVDAGVEHCEVILNYRRDGSPFMNLLMCAPLCDSKGKIRYFIGAQVDVSGLVQECSELESFKRLVAKKEKEKSDTDEQDIEFSKDEFQELSEMLNLQELDTVRRWGGKLHNDSQESGSDNSVNWTKPRVLINPISPTTVVSPQGLRSPYGRWGNKLGGIYDNYLLVRPYPSMYILFASPSLRVPGILQSPFMSKIGGSQRVRDELVRAFADGHGVTAKVKWVSKSDPEGRNRWIHCTPLMGGNGVIGVWMVVIVDDENTSQKNASRMAPPVDPKFGRSYPTSPRNPINRKNLGIIPSRSTASIRDGSGQVVPDSPFSMVTFDLRAD